MRTCLTFDLCQGPMISYISFTSLLNQDQRIDIAPAAQHNQNRLLNTAYFSLKLSISQSFLRDTIYLSWKHSPRIPLFFFYIVCAPQIKINLSVKCKGNLVFEESCLICFVVVVLCTELKKKSRVIDMDQSF